MMRFICFLLGMLGWIQCWAQDPQFSQVYLSKVYLNPAYAGITGELIFANSHRVQWPSTTLQVFPFETHNFSANLGSPRLGLGTGFSFFHNREGEGNLRTVKFGFPITHFFRIGDRSLVSLGLETYVAHKTIDWNKLVFSDQLDPVYGNIHSSSAVPAGIESRNYINFNFGALWETVLSSAKQRKADGSKYSIGLAFHHLDKARVSVIGTDAYTPLKITAHSFLTIVLNAESNDGIGKTTDRLLTFGMIWHGHKSINDSPGSMNTTRLLVSYTPSPNILFGVSYNNKQYVQRRSSQALSMSCIWLTNQTKNFDCVWGFNYDFTLARLGLSNTSGAFEISLLVKIRKVYLTKMSKKEETEAKKWLKKGCDNSKNDMYKNKRYKDHVNFGMYYLP